MFGTGKKERMVGGERIDTLIGDRTRFEGTLHTSDTTHINGILRGDVVSDGMLIIGVSGKVEGNIVSREVLVAGTVCGNLKVSEKLTVSESGVITGDVETKALIIAEGAVFTGMSKMTSSSPDKERSGAKSMTPLSDPETLKVSSAKVPDIIGNDQ